MNKEAILESILFTMGTSVELEKLAGAVVREKAEKKEIL